MHSTHVRTRLAVATALFLATPLWPAATAFAQTETTAMTATGNAATLIASPEDGRALREMLKAAHAVPAPDARSVAKQFVTEKLGIDSDAYIVAHFADSRSRERGEPDYTTSLTEALMEAFPEHSRHTFFAEATDAVGGVMTGGKASPGFIPGVMGIVASKSPREFFRKVGVYLWSRSGPGYIYNTFIARDNVIDTVSEDHRDLDEAFGIFRPGGYTSAYLSRLTLSRVVNAFDAPSTFAELPYVTRLDDDMRKYWKEHGNDWQVLARYHFVHEARRARADCAGTQCVLSDDQYRQIMSAAATAVPLDGPVTMAQLRQVSPAGAGVRRFDINGYAASDIVRFVLEDKSEVLYIPGGYPSFVVVRNEEELWRWVFDQCRNPKKLSRLLAHFSLGNAQDTFLWTGVRHGLEKIGKGEWAPNGSAIDRGNTAILGDVFQEMRAQTEQRMRADAATQSSTAWEGWREVINRSTVLLGPLGYFPSFAIPVQVGTALTQAGTGLEQAIDGRTEEQRRLGLEQVATAAITAPLEAPAFAKFRDGAGGEYLDDNATVTRSPTGFRPPERVNGQLGYLLGPRRAPRFPEDRFYALPDGTVGRWANGGADTRVEVYRAETSEDTDGIIRSGADTFVRWRNAERGTLTRVSIDGDAVRVMVRLTESSLRESAGPLIARLPDGTWDIADVPANDVRGAILDRFKVTSGARRGPGDTGMVDDDILTEDPQTLNRAAQIMEQLGTSEAELLRLQLRETMDSPVAALALVHAFVEALPQRLRNPDAQVWTGWETRIIAPLLARAMNRPIALYDEGTFLYTASPDGRVIDAADGAASRPPDHALAMRLRHGRYNVRDATGHDNTLRSIISAGGWLTREEDNAAAAEGVLRRRMAEELEARSRLPELRRAEDEWIPYDMPNRRTLIGLSRLRHRLSDLHETPDPSDYQQISWTGAGRPATDIVAAGLTRQIQQWNALLPDELDFLVVTDPAVLEVGHRRAWDGDEWSFAGHHYVWLRDLYGRTQALRTSHTDIHGHREIRWPVPEPQAPANVLAGIPNDAGQLDFGQVRHAGSRWIAADSPAGEAYNRSSPRPPIRSFFGPQPDAQPGGPADH